MAKKKNNKKAALSMRAADITTNTTELTPPLSPSQLKSFSEETSLPFSLPTSPVAKIAPSFHLSPTLSTTDSNNPLSSDFNPFLIPPPVYHHDDPQQSVAVEDDWEIPEPQPLKRKAKKAKKNQPVPQLPDDSTDYENSEAPLSDCPPETIQSETDHCSGTEREEESEVPFSVHTILEEPESEPKPELQEEKQPAKPVEDRPAVKIVPESPKTTEPGKS